MYATYTCRKCNKSIEYKKPYGEEFPEKVDFKCKDRDELNDHEDFEDYACYYYRDFGKIKFAFDVAEGDVGNAKNGYTKTVGSYAQSPLSGKRIRPITDSSWNDSGF